MSTNTLAPRDLAALIATVWGEARGEPPEGQHAVANVILNRARARGQSVHDVCHAPRQFSCWNSGDPNRAGCMVLESLAHALYSGEGDNTAGATHYHAEAPDGRVPYWAVGHEPCARIGRHVFYNDVG